MTVLFRNGVLLLDLELLDENKWAERTEKPKIKTMLRLQRSTHTIDGVYYWLQVRAVGYDSYKLKEVD
jgi:hypothetical protein